MKRIKQYTIEMEFVQTFKSCKACSDFFGVSPQCISMICSGNGKWRDFVFRYEEDENREKIPEDRDFDFEINKLPELGAFVKQNIDRLGCTFTKKELQRLKKIKKRRDK